MFKLDRILVPVDFSPVSQHAVTYAAFLGEQFKSSIDVMHVWDPPRYLAAGELLVMAPDEPQQTLAQFVRTRAAGDMEKLLATAEKRGLTVQGRLDIGDVSECILKVSDSYDLIVMGVHARSRLLPTLLGRVSDKVMRRAHCPVMAVHENSDHES